MRWMVAALGAIGLAGGIYFGLQRVKRPVLRVALEWEASNADDGACAAGLELALDERDYRAGSFRLASGHQIWHPNSRNLEFPTPRAHTMMYGVERPQYLPGPDGPLLMVDAQRSEEVIRAWMRERNLERFARYDPFSGNLGIRLRHPDPGHEVLESRPDVVLLYSYYGIDAGEFQRVRAAGFQGPIFLSFSPRWFGAWSLSLSGLEGARFVLAPLKPAPPDFHRRHPHPFAYAGYRGTMRYLDALDADPAGNPLQIVRGFERASIFDELLDEPRIFEVRGSRLEPSK